MSTGHTVGDKNIVDWARRNAHNQFRAKAQREGLAHNKAEQYAQGVMAEECLRFGLDGHPGFQDALLRTVQTTRILTFHPWHSPDIDRAIAKQQEIEAEALAILQSAGLDQEIFHAITFHILELFHANNEQWGKLEEGING
jgi:hypothetical protein